MEAINSIPALTAAIVYLSARASILFINTDSEITSIKVRKLCIQGYERTLDRSFHHCHSRRRIHTSPFRCSTRIAFAWSTRRRNARRARYPRQEACKTFTLFSVSIFNRRKNKQLQKWPDVPWTRNVTKTSYFSLFFFRRSSTLLVDRAEK